MVVFTHDFMNLFWKGAISSSNILHNFVKIWLEWMTMNSLSALVQVMAWRCHPTIHNLSHGWPRSMAALGRKELLTGTEPNWIEVLFLKDDWHHWLWFMILMLCCASIKSYLNTVYGCCFFLSFIYTPITLVENCFWQKLCSMFSYLITQHLCIGPNAHRLNFSDSITKWRCQCFCSTNHWINICLSVQFVRHGSL